MHHPGYLIKGMPRVAQGKDHPLNLLLFSDIVTIKLLRGNCVYEKRKKIKGVFSTINYPEDYYAYIGVSQVVNPVLAVEMGYE